MRCFERKTKNPSAGTLEDKRTTITRDKVLDLRVHHNFAKLHRLNVNDYLEDHSPGAGPIQYRAPCQT